MADPSTVAPFGTSLTAAEREVLAVRALVDSDAEAAVRLGKSVHTVREQLANIRSRLGVRTTARAIVAAGIPQHLGVAITG